MVLLRSMALPVAILVAAPAWAQRVAALNEAATVAVFSSGDTNLVAGDTNNAVDVFVRDLVGGVTTRVSVASNGLAGSGDSNHGVGVDESGRYVVFGTAAALVGNDTNTCLQNVPPNGDQLLPCPDVYLHDRTTGQTTRLSVPAAGGQGNGPSTYPCISADGAWITFNSAASNLVSGDTNGASDVFLVERSTGTISLISTVSGGGTPGNGHSGGGGITADGRYVTFISAATNLTAEADAQPCQPSHIASGVSCYRPYLYDRIANTLSRVALPVFADFEDETSIWVTDVAISPDARHIALNFDVYPGIGLETPAAAVYDRVLQRFVHTGIGSDSGMVMRDGRFATGPYLIENFYVHGLSVADLRSGVPAGTSEDLVPLDIASGGRRLLVGGQGSPAPLGPSTTLASGVSVVNLDGDGDGLPNAWELAFGFDPAVTGDQLADSDGDGVTNAEEYLRGSHPRGTYAYYLAEGATNAFFSTQVAVHDPNAPLDMSTVTPAMVRLLGQNATSLSTLRTVRSRLDLDYRIKPRVSPYPIILAEPVPDASFSTIVESSSPLVVERSMTWGTNGYGSHAERAIAAPATSWYLAEGATHGGFLLYYLLQNPGGQTASVSIAYLRPAPLAPIVKTYTVPPRTRRTIVVDDEDPALAATDVSARVTSSQPIVVERAMYRDAVNPSEFLGVGHAAAGVSAAPRWFLAEGATGTFFDLYYLLANPSVTATRVRVTYLLDQGAPVVKEYDVAALSRRTISVAQEDPRLGNVTLSAIVESLDSTGIVVERAMYWPGGGNWQDGHVTAGATTTARRWATSGGRLDDASGTETFVLVANTSSTPGTITVTVPDYRINNVTLTRTVPIAANARITLRMRSIVPASTPTLDFAVRIESDGPELVVERATYANANGVVWSAGEALLATPLP